MGTFAVTIVTLVLVGSVHVAKAGSCEDSNSTNCSSCVEQGRNCYWCPDTATCGEWDWSNSPDCKGNTYFYRQCSLNGVGFIIVFSFAIFLLLLVIVSCCIFCCCYYMRRRRRSQYVSLTNIEPNRNYERTDMRHRQFHARRDEVRYKYGIDTNDSTV